MKEFTTRLRRKIPLLLCFFGMVLMLTGILSYYIKRDNQINGENLDSNKQTNAGSKIEATKIKIDISGAVEKPGIYELPNDYRIADVLITAGGLSPKADRNYLSKNINLAQHIYDGMKIFIPFQNEIASIQDNKSLLNINIATLSELEALPEIGMTTANKIISNRPYQNINELLIRRIISSARFEKIKSLITTN